MLQRIAKPRQMQLSTFISVGLNEMVLMCTEPTILVAKMVSVEMVAPKVLIQYYLASAVTD